MWGSSRVTVTFFVKKLARRTTCTDMGRSREEDYIYSRRVRLPVRCVYLCGSASFRACDKQANGVQTGGN